MLTLDMILGCIDAKVDYGYLYDYTLEQEEKDEEEEEKEREEDWGVGMCSLLKGLLSTEVT